LIPEIYSPYVLDHDPLPGTGEGLQGVRDSIGGLIEAFPDLRVTIEDMSAHGDHVVVHNTWSGTQTGRLLGLPPTGRRVTFEGIVLWRLEDGKIAERWGMLDTAGMIRQTGNRMAMRSAGARRTIRAGSAKKRRRRATRDFERSVEVRRIPAGKLDAWRRLHEEMEGARKREVGESRRAAGISKEFVWHAKIGSVDYSAHLWESDDPEALYEHLATSDAPFDRHYRERWLDVGIDLARERRAPPPVEKTFEWADREGLRDAESFAAIVLVQPILAGQEEALADFNRQFADDRHAEYVESRQKHGVLRDAAYEQQISESERVEIVYQEIVSGEGFAEMMVSDVPFDRWYRERVLQQHGTDLTKLTGLPSQLVFEWPPPSLAGL
jgi:predicted ester cyclase